MWFFFFFATLHEFMHVKNSLEAKIWEWKHNIIWVIVYFFISITCQVLRCADYPAALAQTARATKCFTLRQESDIHQWLKKQVVQLPYWPPTSQQVSHSRWICGIHHVQAMEHARELIHLGFQTKGRHNQKSETEVSVS